MFWSFFNAKAEEIKVPEYLWHWSCGLETRISSEPNFSLTALRCGSFSKKISKKSTCAIKNHCYFWKSNIPVINLIVGFKNMIKLSENMSLFLPHSKTIKTIRNCWYLVKTTIAVYLIFFISYFFKL